MKSFFSTGLLNPATKSLLSRPPFTYEAKNYEDFRAQGLAHLKSFIEASALPAALQVTIPIIIGQTEPPKKIKSLISQALDIIIEKINAPYLEEPSLDKLKQQLKEMQASAAQTENPAASLAIAAFENTIKKRTVVENQLAKLDALREQFETLFERISNQSSIIRLLFEDSILLLDIYEDLRPYFEHLSDDLKTALNTQIIEFRKQKPSIRYHVEHCGNPIIMGGFLDDYEVAYRGIQDRVSYYTGHHSSLNNQVRQTREDLAEQELALSTLRAEYEAKQATATAETEQLLKQLKEQEENVRQLEQKYQHEIAEREKKLAALAEEQAENEKILEALRKQKEEAETALTQTNREKEELVSRLRSLNDDAIKVTAERTKLSEELSRLTTEIQTTKLIINQFEQAKLTAEEKSAQLIKQLGETVQAAEEAKRRNIELAEEAARQEAALKEELRVTAELLHEKDIAIANLTMRCEDQASIIEQTMLHSNIYSRHASRDTSAVLQEVNLNQGALLQRFGAFSITAKAKESPTSLIKKLTSSVRETLAIPLELLLTTMQQHSTQPNIYGICYALVREILNNYYGPQTMSDVLSSFEQRLNDNGLSSLHSELGKFLKIKAASKVLPEENRLQEKNKATLIKLKELFEAFVSSITPTASTPSL